MADQDKLARTPFTIALSTGGGAAAFQRITKRVALISDTLLLSHGNSGDFHELGTLRETWLPHHDPLASFEERRSASETIFDLMGSSFPRYDTRKRYQERYGMVCPDLAGLGRWLLDAEPLLTAGLAWYLPRYGSGFRPIPSPRESFRRKFAKISDIRRYPGADFLIHDGQAAVEMSETAPEKSKLVRPVLKIDLPFVDGVDLNTFSKITIHEFGSYSGFRYFLRDNFLRLDDLMHAEQPDSEITRLGLQIKEEIRAMDAKMRAARRRRAMAMTGAAIGSVQAVLVAVYGPAWAAAVATALSGGLWAVINAAAEHSPQQLRDDRWYYVWALSQKSAGY